MTPYVTPSGKNETWANTAIPTVTLDGEGLAKDTDYTVSGSYDEGDGGEVPAYYTLTITGKGNYTGTVSKYYYDGLWRDENPDSGE